MISRDDLPETPEWSLPKPAGTYEVPALPPLVELGEN